MKCQNCGNKIEGKPNWTNCAALCAECAKLPRYRYYYLNRPPSIACQPKGFVDRETWMPAQKIPGTEWYALGWVEYTVPLTSEAVWKWEFRPHNGAEVTAYENWMEANGQ